MEKIKLENEIDLRTIDKKDKYKTNIVNIYLTYPKYSKKIATLNALLACVLEKSTKNYPSNLELSKKLMDNYGTILTTDIYKLGSIGGVKISVNFLDNKYSLDGEDIEKEALDLAFEMLFAPNVKDKKFDQKIFDTEKESLKIQIQAQKDNKTQYAIDQLTKTVFSGLPFEIYKLGTIEELEKITNEELYDYYLDLIDNAKIDIICSGNPNVFEKLKQIKINRKLDSFDKDIFKLDFPDANDEVINKCETSDVVQGKLAMALSLGELTPSNYYSIMVYNAILGGTPNSKLFQNVREKANLCYVARSSFYQYFNKIYIITGIEIQNYKKAYDLILEQLKQIENRDFTDSLLEDSKNYIIQSLKSVSEMQNQEIEYEFSNIVKGEDISIDEKIKNIQNVTKQDILDIAKQIKLQASFFLTNGGEENANNK